MADFDTVFNYGNVLVYVDKCIDMANAKIQEFQTKYDCLCCVDEDCMDIVCTEMNDCVFKRDLMVKQKDVWVNMKTHIQNVQNLSDEDKTTLLNFYNASALKSPAPLLLRMPCNVENGFIQDAANLTPRLISSNNMSEILTTSLLNKYPAMCGIGRIGHKLDVQLPN